MTEARRGRAGWSVATQGLAALAAGAGLGAAIEAEAGIVYTDVVPDAVIQNSSIGIDLNNDGQVDWNLNHVLVPGSLLFVSLNSSFAENQVMGDLSNGLPKPFALAAGTAIPSLSFVQVHAIDPINGGFLSSSTGLGVHWFDGTNAYLGLKFDLPDGTHYGWAHVLVEANATNNRATLFDYAYCSEPNAGLSAGATSGSCTAVPLPPSVALLAAGAVTALALRRRGRDQD